MKKKIIILIGLCFLVVIVILVLYKVKTTNKFVGKWNYKGEMVQSIIDNSNGNLILDTKIIKYLEIYDDNKYIMVYENGKENGTYSINNNEIIFSNSDRMVIDVCVLNNDELSCDFYSSNFNRIK